jgi:DNA polymerase III gamma/tau subunit
MECVMLPHTHPTALVPVGDCSLVASAIGNCLDEERETVFDIETVLDDIKHIQSDGAASENVEERLRHVLRGVLAYCHGIHNACLQAVVAVTSELMCALQICAPRRSAHNNWQIIVSTVKSITGDVSQGGGLGISLIQIQKFHQVVRKVSQFAADERAKIYQHMRMHNQFL